MSTTRSPLPWRATLMGTEYVIESALGGHITDYVYPTENAELIVRAVNSHAQLVDALTEALEAWHLENVAWDQDEAIVRAQSARKKATELLAALRLAKGEQS